MNPTGLILGLFMLFCIGFGFLWVIKLEYYLGAGIWKLVLLAGIFNLPGFAIHAKFHPIRPVGYIWRLGCVGCYGAAGSG